MQKRNTVIDDEPLIRMILELQSDMDYDNLSVYLIKSDRTDFFFTLFQQQPTLDKQSAKKAIFAAFNECLKENQMAIALKIWHEYESVLTSKKCIG